MTAGDSENSVESSERPLPNEHAQSLWKIPAFVAVRRIGMTVKAYPDDGYFSPGGSSKL